ncbi:MAG TPA: DNRLRE domain-containing protein [Kineosporiaceae bacterium]|nr:DNRLRE domain-containing protein [Kineosporiaceae bacterium]
MRLVVVSGVVASVVLGGVGVCRPVPAAAAVLDPARPPSAEQVAKAAAVKAGKPVEVGDRTTESSQVFANPDGSLTLRMSVVPQRVRRSGGWVPVDTTLAVNADGSVGPKASVLPLAFSGGGSAPLVQFTSGAAKLALSWPSVLPKPTLTGDTATYTEVLPGVDLAVTAQADSFSQVLIVKTPAAAKLAGVAKPSFGFSVTGGTLKQEADGGFSVRGGAGEQLMRSSRGAMWDSSGTAVSTGATPARKRGRPTLAAPAPAPAAGAGAAAGGESGSDEKGPGEGAKVARLGQTTSGGKLALTADAGVLSSTSTVFPVYIDPPVFGAGQVGHAMVDKSFPDTSYFNWGGADQGLGYQNFNGVDTKRLFFYFPTSAVIGKRIISATLSDVETYASSCTPTPVEAGLTGGFDASTTWNNQPGWLATYDTRTVSYGRAGCTAKTTSTTDVNPNPLTVEWNVTSAVDYAVNGVGAGITTFGLKASNETDRLSWKRFQPSAYLSVTYNTRPDAPISLSGPGGDCKSDPAVAPAVGAGGATFAAWMTDPDHDQLAGTIQYTDPNGVTTTLNAGTHAEGTFTAQSPGSLTAAGTWSYKAYSTDGLDWSPVSATCYFVVDPVAPLAPTIMKDGQPQPTDPATGAPVPRLVGLGTAEAFTFAANAASPDTVGYRWALNGDTPGVELLSVAAGGTASKQVSVTSSGPSTLRVWAYDRAGNQSPPASFLLSANGYVAAHWGLDDATTGSSAHDAVCKPSGSGTAPSGITWTGLTGSGVARVSPGVSGRAGDRALHFSSSTAATTDLAPVVNTSADGPQNLTLLGWVQVDRAALDQTVSPAKLVGTGPRVALSLDGPSRSVFTVGLVADATGAARFQLSVLGQDGTTRTATLDTLPVVAGTWYQLTGSLLPGARMAELGVASYEAGTTPVAQGVKTVTWDATFAPLAPTGKLRLGSGQPGPATPWWAPVTPWAGWIDELYAIRGGLPSDGGVLRVDVAKWAWSVSPHTGQGSPCA